MICDKDDYGNKVNGSMDYGVIRFKELEKVLIQVIFEIGIKYDQDFVRKVRLFQIEEIEYINKGENKFRNGWQIIVVETYYI